MKPYLLPILIQILAVLVIIAEIFIPSLGLLTIIALGLFIYSLSIVFSTISNTAGMVFTGLDIVLVPLVIVFGMKILARSPLALNRQLSKQNGVVSQDQEIEVNIGMKGSAVTDLRPAGTAEIDDRRIDVVTDGDYIETGTSIVVTGVTGNRVIVEKTS